jgi:hypothetical protein
MTFALILIKKMRGGEIETSLERWDDGCDGSFHAQLCFITKDREGI